MEMLKLNGLWTSRYKFHSLVTIQDAKFVEKFVLSYKENVPELLDIYKL